MWSILPVNHSEEVARPKPGRPIHIHSFCGGWASPRVFEKKRPIHMGSATYIKNLTPFALTGHDDNYSCSEAPVTVLQAIFRMLRPGLLSAVLANKPEL